MNLVKHPYRSLRFDKVFNSFLTLSFICIFDLTALHIENKDVDVIFILNCCDNVIREISKRSER